jgi:phosphate starvation-inducible protein PhoH
LLQVEQVLESLWYARAALNFLMKREQIYVTRAAIEVGNSLGYLPGGLDDKFNPYLEALMKIKML